MQIKDNSSDEEQTVLEVMVKKFDLDRTLIDKYKEWTILYQKVNPNVPL